MVVLRLNITEKEFFSNEKLREKVDDFSTAINDRLIEKFNEVIEFDATFSDDKSIMQFTLDTPKALTETCKTIEKLMKSKKFVGLSNKIVEQEDACCCA